MNKPEINLTPTATLLEIESAKKIPCRTWGIASESNTAFLLVHGLGGHSGWFEALARRLKVKHTFVMALDLAGFGSRRDDTDTSIDRWLKDIEAVSCYLHSLMGDKPVFLLGNSMGGLLALKACNRCKPSGLILLSPAFGGHPKLFPMSYQLSSLVSAILFPDKEITLPYNTEDITQDEQVQVWLDKYGNNRAAVPAKVLLDLLFATLALRFKNIVLPCPLLMITAGKDCIVSNKNSDLIFRQVKNPEKKKVVMSKSMHDLTLDLAIDEVTESVINWTNAISQRALKNQKDKQSEVLGKNKV